MTRFACIGSACEDNCCHGWQVQIDRRHYQILKKSMDGSRAEREEFRSSVKRDHEVDQKDVTYARIKLADNDDNCPFLTSKKLCSVQGRYGEKALPQVCSTYPRSIYQNDARLEVWGMMSCPELVRLCLLHEDAMDLVEGGDGLSPRMEPTLGLRGERSPYERYLDDIRAATFSLLSLREHPMANRLFFLAYLGKQTVEFFNRAAKQVDGARLADAIARVSNPQTIALLNRELATMPAPEAVTANLVAELLAERLKLAVQAFRILVDKTLGSYFEIEGATDEKGAPMIQLSDLWAQYARRRKSWLDVASDRVDLYFENYAKNFWMREWYMLSPDLLAHTQRLLVRVALLRFFLFSHPLLKEVPADEDARRALLDQAAVDVFYRFSRGIEHDAGFLDLIAARLAQQGMSSFTLATILALV